METMGDLEPGSCGAPAAPAAATAAATAGTGPAPAAPATAGAAPSPDASSPSPAPAPADIVLVGTIFTGEDDRTCAQGAAIRDGRYVYVGDAASARAFAGPGTRVIEGGDGLFTPGLTDAHIHLSTAAASAAFEVDLTGVESVDGYAEALRAFKDANPGRRWYGGAGWDNAVFEAEGRVPDRALLDSVSADVPVVMRSYDCHSLLVNTAALRLAGIGTGYRSADVGGFVLDGAGEPTGLVREWAMHDIFRGLGLYSVDDYERAILAYQERLLSLGITSAYEPIMDDIDLVNQAYMHLDETGRLKLKVQAGFTVGPSRGGVAAVDRRAVQRDAYRGSHYKNDNIKIFIDGVVESRTAYLKEDYADEPGYRGVPNCSLDELTETLSEVRAKGFQVHMHVIGDAAIDQALTALERVRDAPCPGIWRPTLTHLQLAREDDARRMAALGVCAALNPIWFYKEPLYFSAQCIPYLGEERASYQDPGQLFWRSGITPTVATDAPVAVPDPLPEIETGTTRCAIGDDAEGTLFCPDERMTAGELLQAYTSNGAYQTLWEDECGSVEVGKVADVALFDRNILAIDPHRIREAACLITIADGAIAFERDGERDGGQV